MIEKEIGIRVIAYGVIRALMREAAEIHCVEVDRISFEDTVDTLRSRSPLLAPALFVLCIARRELLRVIPDNRVPSLARPL